MPRERKAPRHSSDGSNEHGSRRRRRKGRRNSKAHVPPAPDTHVPLPAASGASASTSPPARGSGDRPQPEEDTWLGVLEVGVLEHLTAAELVAYATLSRAARRWTEYDALWSRHFDGSEDRGLKLRFVDSCRVKCLECREPTRYVFPLLGPGARLCQACEASKQAPGGHRRYEICSKSDAKHVFLLEGSDLNCLPSIQRSSPWATKRTELRLYLRSTVEAAALAKFGNLQAMHTERSRRKAEDKATPGLVRSEYDITLPRPRRVPLPQPPPDSDSHGGAETTESFLENSQSCSSPGMSSSPAEAWSSDAGNKTAPDTEAEDPLTVRRQRQRRAAAERVPHARAPPEPLGLVIETVAPFTVRAVDPNSIASTRFGVQVGDQLLAVGGCSAVSFAGGWPAIKARLAQRPLVLRFLRKYHPYQRGALAPGKRGGAPGKRGGWKAEQGSRNRRSGTRACGGQGHDAEGHLEAAHPGAGGANRRWHEVDYLSMGVSGLEVLD